MKGLMGVVVSLCLAMPVYGGSCFTQPRVVRVPAHAFDTQNRAVRVKSNFNHDVSRLQVVRQKFVANSYGANAFSHNNNALVVQDKIINFDNFNYGRFNNVIALPVTNFGLDYYYRVITEPERQRQADTIANEVADRVVNRLLQAVKENKVEPQVPEGNDVVIPKKRTPAPVDPDLSDLDNAVFDILQTNCASCHTGADAKKLRIFDDDDELLSLDKLDKWKIFDRIDGSNLPREKIMPKNGEPLDDDEVALIREWVRRS